MSISMMVFLSIIGLGLMISFLRMIRGPTAPDRAVAVDTMTTTITATLVLLGFIFERYVYLDVALIYSLISFVGLVALARFLEKGI
ncbi:cation:proton antiporter [Candidatus Bipolaricaulota bacterium]|nr:cation:proton antiporter [Candidatus Bipolaricaulota bacterium]